MVRKPGVRYRATPINWIGGHPSSSTKGASPSAPYAAHVSFQQITRFYDISWFTVCRLQFIMMNVMMIMCCAESYRMVALGQDFQKQTSLSKHRFPQLFVAAIP